MFTLEDAREFADLIADFGNMITLPNGDTFKAVVETSLDSIRRRDGDSPLENARGRVVLFLLKPSDAALIPPGTLLPYRGQRFTLAEPKTAVFGDVPIITTILGASGGYS